MSGSVNSFSFFFLDRSTGFEQKLFQRMNERKRTGAESYSWGTEDM
jgi:pre-mRNA-splicing factor CWC26